MIGNPAGYKSSALPTGMDSKREILQYLQANCDLDFLRQHDLNSSATVVMKKSNKLSLLKVWDEWSRNRDTPTASSEDVSESLLEDLLQPISTEIHRIIAGTLHETSKHELPYWTLRDAASSPSEGSQVCLFLGAVRDMYESEHDALRRLCQRISVPLTGIRLGPVPEFTIKILTVVAFHHAHGRLSVAVADVQRKG
jgi:hypothetical protein